MFEFLKYKDYGAGWCAVFIREAFCDDREVRLNRKNLEIRIKNLTENRIDASVEIDALNGMPAD